ncbi:MAG TPA: nitronate monooxygenase, partial [Ilumatobacteraceae bacterium]|nr:nitronate monooxygenase [Ilumatobacteraceae bacterium]
ERAVAAGADGLVLLTAGAGGQTGWMNPFAFVRAVRAWFDGPIVLAGGIADGASVWAALALGCDLAYIGTGFIPTREGLASAAYRQAVLAASLDDVELFMQDTGIPASMLRTAATPPPAERDPLTPPSDFSAGHSVSLTNAEVTVAELVARLRAEFGTARAASLGAA